METSNIDAISEEESRRCLPHEEELVLGTLPVLLTQRYQRRYASTTTAGESKSDKRHNVVLPQKQYRVNEGAGDAKDENKEAERQFEANARSAEESNQNAKVSEPREFGQIRSTAEQKKIKKRSADNNSAKVSREDSEEQKGHRGTPPYKLKGSLEEIPPQSDEEGKNTKQKEAETSKGMPCYRIIFQFYHRHTTLYT